ncbi:MAG: hypothetical protein HXY40_18625 [Chloroflexi bacterium]|nr:hypothetical protein [Chloroflexota bacterium]
MNLGIFNIAQNPVARIETALSARAPDRGGLLRRVLRLAFLGWMNASALALLAVEMYALNSGYDPEEFYQLILVPIVGFLAAALVAHFAIMLQTLWLATKIGGRERHHEERWDMLLMTGISAQAIVWGKWWGTVRRVWPRYLLLAWWRIGAGLWLALYVSRESANTFSGMYMTGEATVFAPQIGHILLAALFLLGLTLCNMLLTTACGVWGGLAFRRGALAGAALLRVLGIILFVVGIGVVSAQFFFGLSSIALTTSYYSASVPPLFVDLFSAYSLSLVTLFDNGLTIAGTMTAYTLSVMGGDGQSTSLLAFVLAFLFATVFYVGLSVLALWLAQAQAEKYGALRPRETKVRTEARIR